MKKTLRQLFEERKKLVIKASEVGLVLDSLIQDRWGFSFSETDDDRIIDTLDYGRSALSFEEFVSRMDEYKKSLDENGRFIPIP